MLYKAIGADVGIAPVAKCKFNEAKSSNKVVEYGVLNILPVASDYVTYQGCLPSVFYSGYSDYDWYQSLNKAIDCEDREARLQSNYEFCKKNWDIAVNVEKWENYYKEVLG